MNTLPSIVDGFRNAARARPGHTVIWSSDGGLGYDLLDRASDRVAGALAGQGVRKGDRLALYCINSPELAIVYLGILKAGAVVVPVNLLLNPREVGFILADAGVRALFYHDSLNAQVRQLYAGRKFPLTGIAVGDSPARKGDRLLCDLLEARRPAPRIGFDMAQDLAAILYTSGTTGRPKGAMLTHGNLVANAQSVFGALHLRPGSDRILVVLPMFHAFAATVGMLTPLLYEMSLVPVPRFEPGRVCDAIEASGATVFLGVPSMYRLLLKLTDAQVRQWRRIRFCVSGGSALPAKVSKAFESRFEVPVLEGDGPTECSPVTCVNPLGGERKLGSVGLPVPDVEMRIMDDRGSELPAQAVGEVCVRGPSVTRGYWRLPEATAEAFHGDWFRTGDLGYCDRDGYFFLIDRKKDMIVVNGMNVYPRAIEEVLHQHPKIDEAAVVGEAHDLHGEVPVAHVVAVAGQSLDAARIKAWCRERLGRHEVPRRVLIHDALPRNAAGKIVKRELRRQGELDRGIDSRNSDDL